MLKIKADKLAANLEEYLDVARTQPIEIDTLDGETLILLSAEEYKQLRSLDDAYWAARASAGDAKGDYLGPEQSMRRIVELLDAAP